MTSVSRAAHEQKPIVPAKAGTQPFCAEGWIPAFAGMTGVGRVAVAALLLLLGGCAGTAVLDKQVAQPETPKPAIADMDPAARREHERILAAYNGGYDDPRVETLVSQTVE